MSMSSHERNLFEIDNAKNLARDELVATFVTTNSFKRLLEPKNHVVLGSRGSGKTALARMLSHSHLARLGTSSSKKIIASREVIGIYVSTNIEWVGALKNKILNDSAKAEELFQWRLNLACCIAFLHSAMSCIEQYLDDIRDRALYERKLVGVLRDEWFDKEVDCETINELANQLYDLDHLYETALVRNKVFGKSKFEDINGWTTFSTRLFHPLKRAIKHLVSLIDFPDTCNWFVCIDEAEFLTIDQHRILNTYMRASQDQTDTSNPNLVFKIVTMPYCHYTLQTNVGASLNLDHDFQYIYIDQDPVFTSSDSNSGFVEALFGKRINASNIGLSNIKLTDLFGESELLKKKHLTWERDSEEYQLFMKYSSEKTIKRAKSLKIGSKEFRDQIGRKIMPALLLKANLDKERGRGKSGIYSGKAMVIRCGDSNPRRLIGILNRFLLFLLKEGIDKYPKHRVPMIAKKKQQEILEQYSKSVFMRIKSEPSIGPELYQFIQDIGSYMSACIRNEPLATDQVSSIRIDDSVSDQQWQIITRAVTLGLLYPNKNIDNPDHIPDHQGVFHLSYVLAPYFKVLPRREGARSIHTITSAAAPKSSLQMGLL